MVAAMALGAMDALFDITVPYAKERIQFGSPLSEKQGYTHKLIVPHAVRRLAASAYIDEVALRLDNHPDEDFQVEGSIAKFFSTEASNAAADSAMQALGGYGYICEFEVEKIKRDVKITCIYEGTSEIQQNIISTFRWKKTRKTKGGYYEGLAEEMSALAESHPGCGARSYAVCARALNAAVNLAHEHRLTKLQHVMFALADMMTHVEVGIGLSRKAAAAAASEAEMFQAASRIFANEVCQLMLAKLRLMLAGSGAFEESFIAEFMEKVGESEMVKSYAGIIADMDRMADHIFERAS
jgi:alkylation response protein AidB-like acyl-CoA dehydrogenase